MADSKRKLIMDAALADLALIEGVAYVSERIVHWEELDRSKFPALFPLDEDEEKSPYVFTSIGKAEDRKSVLTLRVTGYVYAADDETRASRVALIQAVEKTLCAVGGKVLEVAHSVEPRRVITDKGTIPNYSIWDQEFAIEYHYRQADGG